MALELIVNLLLIAGGIFCFVNVSTTMPHSAVNELGAEQWPQAILVLMLIALAFNVIRFFKINKKEDIKAGFQDFFPAIGRFVKSKLFLGMVLVVVMGFLSGCGGESRRGPGRDRVGVGTGVRRRR